MVQHLDVYKGQRLFQAAGQHFVGVWWLSDIGGVVVRQDDRRRVVGQCRFDDFARIDAGLRQGAGEQFVGLEQPVLGVQPKRYEDFMLANGEFKT